MFKDGGDGRRRVAALAEAVSQKGGTFLKEPHIEGQTASRGKLTPH